MVTDPHFDNFAYASGVTEAAEARETAIVGAGCPRFCFLGSSGVAKRSGFGGTERG